MAKIRGFYQNSKGYWMFQPSAKGLGRRPKAISLGTKSETEALLKLVAIRGADIQQERRSLREWADAYLFDRQEGGHYRPVTLSGVKATMRRLLVYFGNRDPGLIARSDCTEWFGDLRQGRSLATAHRDIRYARAFFSWLIDRGAIAANPFSRLRLPTPTQSRRDEFCTPAQRDHLLSLCDRDDLRFILHCGFFLGMRIREIVNARWDWFGDSAVTVRNLAGGFETKTRKERMIPMGQRFKVFWAEFPKDVGVYVLHDHLGQRPERHLRYDPRRPFQTLTGNAGLPWVTFHVMRHTFGSLHAMAGTPELKIRRWMGITPQTFERHYAGLRSDDPDADRI